MDTSRPDEVPASISVTMSRLRGGNCPGPSALMTEWDSSAIAVSAMKCEICFPLECHQMQTFALPSSGKRESARVSLALVPDLSNYAVFIPIHDAYHGFGSDIAAYSYINRQPIERKYDIFLD